MKQSSKFTLVFDSELDSFSNSVATSYSFEVNNLRGLKHTKASEEIRELFLLPKTTNFFKGYFESSVPLERSENNRVLFNMTSKFQATDCLRTWPVIPRGKSHACLDWDK